MASSPHYAMGRYVCEVLAQAMSETQTGKPQFVLRFKILGTPDAKNPENYVPDSAQYERTFYRVITEGTIEYFTADLHALGFDGDSFKLLDPATLGFYDFKGQIIDMICNHEDNQDKTGKREKWGIARKAGEFAPKPLEPKKVRDLDNLFGKHLKSLKPNGTPVVAAPNPPATQSAPAISDEDVPF